MRSNHLPYILLLSVCLLLLSCGGNGDVRRLLDRAEQLLPQQPDSAACCLDSVLERAGRLNRLTAADRARYALLRTSTSDRIGHSVGSDTLIRPAHDYYAARSREGTAADSLLLRRYAQSCFYLGRFYAQRDSTKQAETLYRQAAGTAEKCSDWRTAYLAYFYLSQQMIWSNQAYAGELAKKSLDLFGKIGDDTANEIYILLNLGYIHLINQLPDSAFSFYDEALDKALSSNQSDIVPNVYRNYAVANLTLGDNKKALEIMKRGIDGLTHETRDASLLMLGYCYLRNDSLQQATEVLEQIAEGSDKKLAYSVSSLLCEAAVRQNNTAEALKQLQSIDSRTTAMLEEALQLKDAYYQDLIRSELKAKEISSNKRLLQQRVWFGLVLAACILFFLYRNIAKRIRLLKRKRERSVKNHKKDVESLVSIEKSLRWKEERIGCQRQEIAKLQEELHARQQEHGRTSDELRELKDIISQKQQMLDEEIVAVNMERQHYAEALLMQRDKAVQETSVYQKIQKGYVASDITSEDWTEAEHILNVFDGDFVNKVKAHTDGIKDYQLQVCMLMRMGLSKREICRVYSITDEALKKRRQSIKRQVFGVLDVKVSIDDIIANL